MLNRLFQRVMVINPSIEVYLLDTGGAIVAYNAPPSSLAREQVSLIPIGEFLSGDARFPLVGDDPRSATGSKVFSVATVPGQGYLYIVLGGERYDHVAEMIASSYSLYTAVGVLLAALVVTLIGGLLVFLKAGTTFSFRIPLAL